MEGARKKRAPGGAVAAHELDRPSLPFMAVAHIGDRPADEVPHTESSQDVQERFQRGEQIDDQAAAIILQQYFDDAHS